MSITAVKWFAIVALITVLFDPGTAGRPLMLFVIFVGAVLVSVQAAHAREYVWSSGFVLIALLFNPIVAIAFSSAVMRWLEIVCAASFLVSLVLLRAAPLRWLPSRKI
jgi:hypothetical protein